MCEVDRTQNPDMGWYCKKTGKPIIHTTPVGMFCEDRCGYDATASIMDKVQEAMGGNPQAFLNELSEPGGFERVAQSIARKLDTSEMKELYQRQKELNPNLDEDVEQFDSNIEEIFRHGNNSRK